MAKKKQIEIRLGEELKAIDDELDAALGRLEVANENVKGLLTSIGEQTAQESPSPDSEAGMGSSSAEQAPARPSAEPTSDKVRIEQVGVESQDTPVDSA